MCIYKYIYTYNQIYWLLSLLRMQSTCMCQKLLALSDRSYGATTGTDQTRTT